MEIGKKKTLIIQGFLENLLQNTNSLYKNQGKENDYESNPLRATYIHQT